ncbi:MAG: hypothetical protein IKU26_00170 [Clostridia bacterium]|nr:hypothetical protein [Clostridia bacterium]
MADSKCEQCTNYVYDDEYETYCCLIDLDQDEMALFITDTFAHCPYYDPGDEYKLVRKQM